jgi:hypothetical protein
VALAFRNSSEDVLPAAEATEEVATPEEAVGEAVGSTRLDTLVILVDGDHDSVAALNEVPVAISYWVIDPKPTASVLMSLKDPFSPYKIDGAILDLYGDNQRFCALLMRAPRTYQITALIRVSIRPTAEPARSSEAARVISHLAGSSSRDCGYLPLAGRSHATHLLGRYSHDSWTGQKASC